MSIMTPDLSHQMVDRFRRSAESYARSALLRITSDGERERGTMDAGVAVEHMAKALLCKFSPTLIADRSADFDTLLHLAGHGKLAKTSIHTIKTIGAHEACVRCEKIIPEFAYAVKSDNALFVARNGSAHLAWITNDMARESARIMVRLLEPLITALDLDRARFWSDMESVASTLLDEKVNQIRATLGMKIAAARARLAERLEGLDADASDRVLKALTVGRNLWSDQEGQECPACHQIGTISCAIEDTDDRDIQYETYGDGDEVEATLFIGQIAVGLDFQCDACGIDLDHDEMLAAEMTTEFERDDRIGEPWELDPPEWD